MSYNAYQRMQQTSENPRETEYRLFATVTKALMDVKDLPVRDPKVIKALDWNRRMWSTFSSDCGLPGNQLPKELRASIISLSLWVSKHSSLVMRQKAKIDNLISVNRTVMAGLKPQQAQQTQPGQQTTTTQNAGSGAPIGNPLGAYLSI